MIKCGSGSSSIGIGAKGTNGYGCAIAEEVQAVNCANEYPVTSSYGIITDSIGSNDMSLELDAGNWLLTFSSYCHYDSNDFKSLYLCFATGSGIPISATEKRIYINRYHKSIRLLWPITIPSDDYAVHVMARCISASKVFNRNLLAYKICNTRFRYLT